MVSEFVVDIRMSEKTKSKCIQYLFSHHNANLSTACISIYTGWFIHI